MHSFSFSFRYLPAQQRDKVFTQLEHPRFGEARTGARVRCLRSIGRTKLCETDRTRVLAVSLFSGMCGVMVHCYFENIFEVPYMMAYFWSMAAAVLYLGYFRKTRKA